MIEPIKNRTTIKFFIAAKAIFVLWSASIFSAFFAFLTQILLARTLNLQDYGIFTSSLALITIVTPIAGLGVNQYWLKVFGEEGDLARRWIKPSLQLTLTSTAILTVLIWIFALLHKDALTQTTYIILSAHLLCCVLLELATSKLQTQGSYTHIALLQITPNTLRLILIYLYTNHTETPSTFDIATIYLITTLVICIYFTHTFNNFRTIGNQPKPPHTLATPTIKKTFQHSWHFGLATLCAFIYGQSDLVMIKYMTGAEEAGVYNVALTVLFASFLLPTAIFQKYLLPKLHRWATHDPKKFADTFILGNKLMLAIGILFTAVMYITSNLLITELFGEKYSESIFYLELLSLCIPFIFLSYCSGAILSTRNNIKTKVRLMATTAILNISMNLYLIPIHGTPGAIYSTIASYAFLAFLYHLHARKEIHNR